MREASTIEMVTNVSLHSNPSSHLMKEEISTGWTSSLAAALNHNDDDFLQNPSSGRPIRTRGILCILIRMFTTDHWYCLNSQFCSVLKHYERSTEEAFTSRIQNIRLGTRDTVIIWIIWVTCCSSSADCTQSGHSGGRQCNGNAFVEDA